MQIRPGHPQALKRRQRATSQQKQSHDAKSREVLLGLESRLHELTTKGGRLLQCSMVPSVQSHHMRPVAQPSHALQWAAARLTAASHGICTCQVHKGRSLDLHADNCIKDEL
eukprot:6011484-Amphidinium_carterae.1